MNQRRTEKITLVVAVLMLAALSIAAVTITPVFVQTPQLMVIQLPTAGLTPQALGPTPGADGTKCTGMTATNTSANPYTLQVTFIRSAVNYVQMTVLVPANSGNTAAALPINMMSAANWPGLPIDSDGNPFFYLKSGDGLQANSTVVMADPAKVSVMAVCGNF